jgi:Spy/CpxP family protein refolding chaperone
MAKTWQVILATIAIFVAGLVAGGATAFGLIRWNHERQAKAAAGQPNHPGKVEQFGPGLLRGFIKQLDLTDAQRARIQPIVRRTVGQLARERREVQLSTALTIERMQDEIADVLTPEQRARFEDLIAKQRERLQEFRKAQQQQQAEDKLNAGAPPPPEPPK